MEGEGVPPAALSTYMEDWHCFCAICGFIVGLEPHEDQPGIQDWWKAVLFRARPTHECESMDCPRRHNGDGQTLEKIYASYTEGGPNAFYDPNLDEPFRKTYHTINDIWADKHPWIAVHPKCLEIAMRVVDFRKTKTGNTVDADEDNSPATSIGRLYEIYRSRCELQTSSSPQLPYAPPFIIVWEPHTFFGFGYSVWGARSDWEEGDLTLSQFEACPFPLSGITEEILSYLVLLPDQYQEPTDIPSSPAALNEIISQYSPLENPPLDPERTVSSSTWREMLFSGKVLPWLWDLDYSALKSLPLGREEPYNENGVWDWELLVRRLAQVDVFEEGKLMADIQLGLRNRRRIWRLVDVARMNDWTRHTR